MKNTSKNQNLAIFLLITMIIAVVVAISILGAKFSFPDIIRQPAANAFTLFRKNQNSIIFGYYVFLLSALLFIPLSYLLHKSLNQCRNKVALNMLVGLRITTAIFQSIGFIRWIFAIPYIYFVSSLRSGATLFIGALWGGGATCRRGAEIQSR